MIRFALQGLLARKLRTALTAIGIVLGVSLISGTYVLTDSISSALAWPTVSSTGRPSCPAVSSSGSLSPAPWCHGRP